MKNLAMALATIQAYSILRAMNRSFRYRLYPTRKQAAALDCHLEVHRQIYNAGLQEFREAWDRRRETRRYTDLASQLKPLRAEDPAVAFANYSALQQTLRRLDKARTAFFRRVKAGQTPGYPRYKGKHRFTAIEYRWGDGIHLTRTGRLYVQRVGDVKLKLHRPVPKDTVIMTACLKRGIRSWEGVLRLEVPDPRPVEHSGPVVGIGVGLRSLLALPDGVLVENPRWPARATAKLTTAQRVLSRRTLRSQRWRKQRRIVARQQEHIANQRRDFLHQLSTDLTRRYRLLALEDLPVTRMVHGTLARSIHDAGWDTLRSLLAYRVVNTDSQLIVVSPHGTSQTCGHCGTRVAKDLSVRTHTCPACGLVLDRDINAARNILARALESSTARTEPSAISPALAGCSREAPDV